MIYAISDLHLSYGTNKPMNVFGEKWENYEKKIQENWIQKVHEDDTVILAGDFSWATYLEESVKDFEFLNSLPGKKILLKGNHDYWWETVSKLNKFIDEHDFKNIYFLHNNFYETEKFLICGTRYWQEEDDKDNEKIFNREIERAKISLNSAISENFKKSIIFVTHYPPDERLIQELDKYPIEKWVYGHVHSKYDEMLVSIEGIDTYLTSCDYLNFDLIAIDN